MNDGMIALGVLERGRIWRSTLTGALYRWNTDTWETQFKQAPDWHAVRAGAKVLTVYAQSSERFERVE